MAIFEKIKKLNLIFNFFYPSFCRYCNVLIEQDSIFCLNCFSKINPVATTFLPITKKKSLKVYSACEYKDPLRSLILKKTFSDILASKQLAKIILQKTILKKLDIDFIVPIPLHISRYAFRGYNQASVIAKVLGKELEIPYINLLRRKKRTIFQSKLSVSKRQSNLKDAFDIAFRYKIFNTDFIKNKNIMLVDDLCTTGATLKNAGRVLFNLKPKSICAVVACRVV
ncbi:ComF family protein [Candidatus Babeliales bacterium]|nr:ComF family protein [Candidatus Babeliales bacterium]